MELNDILIEKIKFHLNQNLKQESCGVVYMHEGCLDYMPCINYSSMPSSSFSIDPMIIISYDVKYIVHSHINSGPEPSLSDVKYAENLDLPYIIYSTKEDRFYIHK